MLRVNMWNGSEKRRKDARNFAVPATRKKRNNAVRAGGWFRHAHIRAGGIEIGEERMAHKGREAWLEKARLKWKEATEVVKRAFDFRNATLLPSPDLWADDMDRANAARLCVGCQFQVEARIINRANDVGSPRINRVLHRALDTKKEKDIPQDRGKSHHRQIGRLKTIILIAANGRIGQARRQCACINET